MTAVLLVAHGSRRESSNDEIRQVTEHFRQQAQGQFEYIDCAFLELATPSIPDGIKKCIEQGASEVVVLPYFLSAGRHVSEDIPEIVADSQAEFPQTPIRIAPYLGSSAGIIQALIGLANN